MQDPYPGWVLLNPESRPLLLLAEPLGQVTVGIDPAIP